MQFLRRNIFALCALVVFLGSSAPQDGEINYAPRGSFAALSVPDADASVNWYREMLGFELVNSTDMANGIKMRNVKRANALLEFVEHPSASSVEKRLPDIEKPYQLHGIWKLGFSVTDFDSLHAQLTQNSATFHGGIVTDADGTRMLIVLDNAGNRVQLFETR